MSNSNNIDEASRVSEPILNDAPPQKILNDIIPYLRESAESEEDVQSPYGPVIIDSEQMITAFVDSQIGGRKENQDSAGFKDTALGAVIVVCDGMGGMNGGQKASSLAVTTILDIVAAASSDADRKEILVEAIRKANEAILAYGTEYPSYAGMGTTVTALIVSDYSAVVAYVGDSRVYQLRNGKKVFRTFDHSMVFEMVKRKALTEEQARLSAQSNVILKALGVSQSVEPDVFELPYQKGDRFILCSDGFWGAMPEESFLSEVSGKGDTDKVLADMMKKVDEIGNDSGGKHDNLTAAFVDVKQDSKLKEKMNKTAKMIIGALAACLLVSLVFNIIPDKKSDAVLTDTQTEQTVSGTDTTGRRDAEEVEDNKLFAISTLMYDKVYFVEFDGESGILKYGRDSNNLTEVSLNEVGISEHQSLFDDADILKIYYGSFLNQNGGKNEFTVAVTDKNCLMKISNTDNLIPLTILNNN